MVRGLAFSSGISVAFLLIGCQGGDGLPREAISGTVSMDDTPLKSGSIRFVPAASSDISTAVETPIVDGRFQVQASQGLSPGAYQVVVSSPQSGTPSEPKRARRARPGVAEDTSGTGAEDAPEEPPTRETIPTKYNTATTLKAEVTKGGPNTFDFPLSSK